MNRTERHKFGALLAFLLCFLAASCSKTEVEDNIVQVKGGDPIVVADGDMPVCLGYELNVPSGGGFEFDTKASVVGGDESDDYIGHMVMLCFTKEGIFLDTRSATLEGDQKDYTHYADDGTTVRFHCKGRDLFVGSVPASTCRVHFIGFRTEADAEGKLPTSELQGYDELHVIKSMKLSENCDDRDICYWGFHGENSPDDMRKWLAEAEVVDGKIIYSKKQGSIVHMIRDRARVEFGGMNDVFDVDNNPIGYKILKISWILTGGLDHGYIAPFNSSNSDDHFGNYINESTGEVNNDRLTPYNETDAKRYVATEEQMVEVWNSQTGNVSGSDLFLFEDENDVDNPPRIILKVEYMKNRNGSETDPDNLVTKYHALMLLNGDMEPIRIFRNHSYVLSINALPWDGLGYSTFAEALATTSYANNPTVTIDDHVAVVSNGEYDLNLTKGTYFLYNSPSDAGQTKTVEFKYTRTDTPNAGVEGVTAADFKATWTTTPFPSFASEEVTVSDYDTTTGIGHVQFTLGSIINNSLQSGVIRLRDNKTGMARFITVYTITQFSFLSSDGKAPELVKTTETQKMGDTENCPVYTLDVPIPGDYPVGLYPLKIRMASMTLCPYKYEVLSAGVSSGSSDNIDVELVSTSNGSLLDGEVLAGMEFSSDATQWNFSDASTLWNYWYTVNIQTKPMKEENGATVEDNTEKVYRIYLADVRPLRAAANQASNVGLFLKIKYFGDAVQIHN